MAQKLTRRGDEEDGEEGALHQGRDASERLSLPSPRGVAVRAPNQPTIAQRRIATSAALRKRKYCVLNRVPRLQLGQLLATSCDEATRRVTLVRRRGQADGARLDCNKTGCMMQPFFFDTTHGSFTSRAMPCRNILCMN